MEAYRGSKMRKSPDDSEVTLYFNRDPLDVRRLYVFLTGCFMVAAVSLFASGMGFTDRPALWRGPIASAVVQLLFVRAAMFASQGRRMVLKVSSLVNTYRGPAFGVGDGKHAIAQFKVLATGVVVEGGEPKETAGIVVGSVAALEAIPRDAVGIPIMAHRANFADTPFAFLALAALSCWTNHGWLIYLLGIVLWIRSAILVKQAAEGLRLEEKPWVFPDWSGLFTASFDIAAPSIARRTWLGLAIRFQGTKAKRLLRLEVPWGRQRELVLFMLERWVGAHAKGADSTTDDRDEAEEKFRFVFDQRSETVVPAIYPGEFLEKKAPRRKRRAVADKKRKP